MLCVGVVVDYFGGLGITLGAHRLWSHRSFKAKWPLRLLAALAQTVAGQVHCNIQYHSFGFYQLRGIYILDSNLRMGQRPSSSSQIQ